MSSPSVLSSLCLPSCPYDPPVILSLSTGSVVMSLIIPSIGHLCGPFLLLFFVVLSEVCQLY